MGGGARLVRTIALTTMLLLLMLLLLLVLLPNGAGVSDQYCCIIHRDVGEHLERRFADRKGMRDLFFSFFFFR